MAGLAIIILFLKNIYFQGGFITALIFSRVIVICFFSVLPKCFCDNIIYIVYRVCLNLLLVLR